jgi:hypothetical protein
MPDMQDTEKDARIQKIMVIPSLLVNGKQPQQLTENRYVYGYAKKEVPNSATRISIPA